MAKDKTPNLDAADAERVRRVLEDERLRRIAREIADAADRAAAEAARKGK